MSGSSAEQPRHRYTAAALALVAAFATGTCAAQRYPDKPIRLIVPTAPGGANDLLARTIGPALFADVLAPVKTSPAIVAKLHELFREETDRWGGVVRSAAIKPEMKEVNR